MDVNHQNYKHNASLLADLDIGDLIEFPRGIYSHWAVYIGGGEVAHLAGEDDDGINAAIKSEHAFTICGKTLSKAEVCRDDFWDVVVDSKARKNNKSDSKWRPLDPAEIVRNAIQKLGVIGYNLFFSNCEHFAKWCRYGISKSDQVDNVLTGVAVGIGTLLALGVTYAISKFSKSAEEEEKKKETTKYKN